MEWDMDILEDDEKYEKLIREQCKIDWNSVQNDLANSDPNVSLKAVDQLQLKIDIMQGIEESDDEFDLLERDLKIENRRIAKDLLWEQLIKILNEPSDSKYDRLKISTVWLFADIGGKDAVDYLINLLHDDSVRGACVPNIIELKKYSFDPLIKKINDNDKYVRREVVYALGEIGNKEATKHLVELLDDPDWSVRLRTIDALGKIGANETSELIAESLNDKSTKVRRKAQEVLDRMN